MKKLKRKGREFALQILYQLDMSHSTQNHKNKTNSTSFLKDMSPGLLQQIIDSFFTNFEKSGHSIEYSSALVRGVVLNILAIDESISKYSIGWRLERLSTIDRSILRLACYEIIYAKNLDTAIIINEAIEIAKKYGNEQSSSFINGILDKIAKKFR